MGRTGDSNFDNNEMADRVKRCGCCNMGWAVSCCIFGSFSAGLFIIGLVVTIFAAGFGDDTWFEDMVKDSGVEFTEGSRLMEKMYTTLRTCFIMVGVCFLIYGCAGGLVLYCKKCICTCGYNFMTFLLFIFTLVVAIPTFSVWNMENETVDSFCKNDFEALPFDFADYFREHPD